MDTIFFVGSPAAGRRVFSPLFVDNTDINDAYLMIDPQRFTIIPAVPPGPHHTRTQKSLENTKQTNILFPATSGQDPGPNPSPAVSRNQNNNSINNLAKNPATRPPPPGLTFLTFSGLYCLDFIISRALQVC